MNEKLVSIVMVNYNQERFIKEAIDSVIAQTYQNWELIIVDDGSTDQSVDIIKNYDDDRIKPIYLEENSHICIATNVGFSHVTGEYIARLDSDDVWEKEKLYKQVALLEEKPNARVCFTQVNLIDENGQNINEKESELGRTLEHDLSRIISALYGGLRRADIRQLHPQERQTGSVFYQCWQLSQRQPAHAAGPLLCRMH